MYLATQIFVKPLQMSQNFTTFGTLIVFPKVKVVILPKRERFYVITEKSSYQLMKHQILYQVGYFLPFRSALRLFPTVSAVGEI